MDLKPILAARLPMKEVVAGHTAVQKVEHAAVLEAVVNTASSNFQSPDSLYPAAD